MVTLVGLCVFVFLWHFLLATKTLRHQNTQKNNRHILNN